MKNLKKSNNPYYKIIKFLLLFAFAKRRIPSNPIDLNSSSKVDSANCRISNIVSLRLDSANLILIKILPNEVCYNSAPHS